MGVDIGEELVGAYLTEIKECDHVLYNVRAPGGGLRGLKELDVIGLKFSNNTAYLCEVTTHLKGLLIGKGYDSTIRKIREKHQWQVEYAQVQLRAFRPDYQFWSPWVPEGRLLRGLEQILGLQLVVNKDYTARVEELRARARAHQPSPTSNMAFRLIQIIEHLR
jgi:hypothetical protein